MSINNIGTAGGLLALTQSVDPSAATLAAASTITTNEASQSVSDSDGASFNGMFSNTSAQVDLSQEGLSLQAQVAASGLTADNANLVQLTDLTQTVLSQGLLTGEGAGGTLNIHSLTYCTYIEHDVMQSQLGNEPLPDGTQSEYVSNNQQRGDLSGQGQLITQTGAVFNFQFDVENDRSDSESYSSTSPTVDLSQTPSTVFYNDVYYEIQLGAQVGQLDSSGNVVSDVPTVAAGAADTGDASDSANVMTTSDADLDTVAQTRYVSDLAVAATAATSAEATGANATVTASAAADVSSSTVDTPTSTDSTATVNLAASSDSGAAGSAAAPDAADVADAANSSDASDASTSTDSQLIPSLLGAPDQAVAFQGRALDDNWGVTFRESELQTSNAPGAASFAMDAFDDPSGIMSEVYPVLGDEGISIAQSLQSPMIMDPMVHQTITVNRAVAEQSGAADTGSDSASNAPAADDSGSVSDSALAAASNSSAGPAVAAVPDADAPAPVADPYASLMMANASWPGPGEATASVTGTAELTGSENISMTLQQGPVEQSDDFTYSTTVDAGLDLQLSVKLLMGAVLYIPGDYFAKLQQLAQENGANTITQLPPTTATAHPSGQGASCAADAGETEESTGYAAPINLTSPQPATATDNTVATQQASAQSWIIGTNFPHFAFRHDASSNSNHGRDALDSALALLVSQLGKSSARGAQTALAQWTTLLDQSQTVSSLLIAVDLPLTTTARTGDKSTAPGTPKGKHPHH